MVAYIQQLLSNALQLLAVVPFLDKEISVH